jgi:hypothetical protein
MGEIEFKSFCQKRLFDIISSNKPKPFLFYIDNNIIKQAPIGITPMIVGNKSGQQKLWNMMCKIQSLHSFECWCI